jgi:hypothetical protein
MILGVRSQESDMQGSAKVVIARIVAIYNCYNCVIVLLRLAHVLPQSKGLSVAYSDYNSLFQHVLVALPVVIDLVASICLLKIWRISAALFTLSYVELLFLGIYRVFIAPKIQISAFASHHNVVFYFVVTQALSTAFVLYVWWVTAESSWFDSHPDWNASAESVNCL